MNPIIFTVPVAVGLGMAGLVVAYIRAERRRNEGMARASETIGFAFTPKGDPGELKARADLPLFGNGHSRKVRNVMTGRMGGVEAQLFDYQYTVGGGKHSHTWRQTVALLPAPPGLPDFVLAPENIFHKVGQRFGYQDIDFDHSPEFSSRYLLRGTDETAIRAAFSQDRLAFLAGQPGWTVESRGAYLGIYRAGKRCRPEDLPGLVADVQSVWQALR
ncbi:MAG TPA: hypothetical protein VK911_11915 [Vicinamibacterales bacterium]|nr:hypothetical protein [Vicinamibacterales bacterium]